MPAESLEIHAKLASHQTQIEGHRRELDGLWVNDKTRSEQITKVRIEIAKWLGLGGGALALGQVIVAKLIIDAINRANGAQ